MIFIDKLLTHKVGVCLRSYFFQEQRKRELNTSGGRQNGASATFNPFGGHSAAAPAQPPPPSSSSKPSDDLLNLFDAPVPAMPVASQQPMLDSTNPFATGVFPQQPAMASSTQPGFFGAPSSSAGTVCWILTRLGRFKLLKTRMLKVEKKPSDPWECA